jgi:ribonuclease E
MYQPVVQLKSGGYLVINPTEALVSIDINSGRSTREHNIEQTAFATNLEAAAEIARQLRLRDMAGLVVIDFIDMEQSSHVRKVEKAMKEALKNDRARIQVGRISSFGLMEMSRQRLRTGVLEASTKACPHCEGTGLMRTASSAGLSALRIVEDEAARGRGDKVMLRAGREAAIYVLNRKRLELGEIEARYGVTIDVVIDEALEGARMSVESSGPRPVTPARAIAAPIFEEDEEDVVDVEMDEDEEDREETEREPRERAPRGAEPRDEDGVRRRRRRRRGGRGRTRRDEGGEGLEGDREAALTFEGSEAVAEVAETERPERSEEGEAPRARRGRRGGRGRSRRAEGGEAPAETATDVIEPDSSPIAETTPSLEPPIAEVEPGEADAKPKTRRRPRARKAEAAEPVAAPASEAPLAAEPEAEAEAKPKRPSRAKPKAETAAEAEPVAKTPEKPARAPRAAPALAAASGPNPDNDAAEGEDSSENPRSGWWQRTFG